MGRCVLSGAKRESVSHPIFIQGERYAVTP
nr:MAG TPA: hypothetical protein [Caudoviricetes sp.]